MYRAVDCSATAAVLSADSHPALPVAPVRIVDDSYFKTTAEFIAYLLDNFKNYFWNAGFVRVPDEAVLSRGATPLDHRLLHCTVGSLGSSLYTISVPPHACQGLCDTLRVDVIADRPIKVQLKRGSAPSLLTSGTAKGRKVGNNQYSVAAGPDASVKLEPGLWFISVTNPSISTIKYSICAKLFQDTDKYDVNPALMGGITVQSVDDGGDGDSWELIACDNASPDNAAVAIDAAARRSAASGCGALTAVAAPTAAAPVVAVAGQSLTQGTDLRTLSTGALKAELFARGVHRDTTNDSDRAMLEATLFSLLPRAPVTSHPPQYAMATPPQAPAPAASAPPPSYAEAAEETAPPPRAPVGTGAGGSADNDDAEGNDNEVLAEGEAPYEFCCPITQDVLADPVIAADGFTYERAAMETWLGKNNTSPLTGMVLSHKNLTPNLTLRTVIVAWQQEQTTAP
eukprot:m.11908 g.11908  ORF g.11908 m.11908 type:complete len:456 (+) comp9173_c0_seq2:957-2324(+)